MPRPSRNIDQALLQSGRVLYEQHGAALPVRALAEHAGANPGMFHYHFKSKDNFLRVLLQQLYDEMYAQLVGVAAQAGTPLEQLRHALLTLARFVRDHPHLIGRLWAEAAQGEPVAREFMQRNAPRHLRVLLQCMEEAERAGLLQPMPPLQRLPFVMGAVVAPLMIVPRLLEWGIAPTPVRRHAQALMLSDAAISARIDLALDALRARTPPAAPPRRKRRPADA